MKQYYTLVQSFQPTHKNLQDYLEEQGISYTVGADMSEELWEYGFKNPSVQSGVLLKKFTILIDEHELSAIMLSVDDVSVIRNRSGVKVQNKFRSYFSWILD